MGASCLLAVKLGFQWHKATGEPIEPTPVAKPPSVPPDTEPLDVPPNILSSLHVDKPHGGLLLTSVQLFVYDIPRFSRSASHELSSAVRSHRL
jgi:hypothetical protein